MTRPVIIACLAAVAAGITFAWLPAPRSAGAETDELTRMGMPPDVGRDEVEAYCGACHSLKLVAQQGLSREAWDEVLVWMVEEQEMPELDPEDHTLVLDYLAKHLSIEARRAARD